MNIYTRMLICLTVMAILIVPSFAQPTPFAIKGWVFYEGGNPCDDPMVNITNLDTSAKWQAETNASSSHYQIILISGTDLNATEILRFDVTGGTNTSVTNHTISVSEVNDGGIFNFNITLGPTSSDADLNVTGVTVNCGYLFGNESNEISATIKNNGSGNAGAFNVSFSVGGISEQVTVSSLAAGNSTTVSVTDPTIRNAGDSVPITVTADCNGEIVESNETNNVSSITKTVVNNGYKGKRYTGGTNMTTWKSYDLNGNLVYSAGDSYYLSSYSYPDWTTYNVSWTASDLPVSGTVIEARLYTMYTWDKKDVMSNNANLKFNDALQTVDKHYKDEKMYATSYPYGMLVYNVTDDFNATGNYANLTNSYPGGGNVSMRGMLLVAIYEDAGKQRRVIYINEEFDLLYGGSGKCTTPDEATDYAPIGGSIDAPNASCARLITIAPGADGSGSTGEGELIFNGHVWNDEWRDNEVHQIGISDRDVTLYLQSTDNLVGFQSNADWMEASNAFLVVTFGILGDVNQDSEITPADAVMVLEMAVRGEYSEAADVSEDGCVTSLDALMILQAVANNVTL
ncbi:MAG: hypothetical protein EMLJLAPB_00339 [Candidatus Argoarchaeum ethanivorans]|uniref:CARDB domain-containing protein n=1 Tax=Candidatus Argoarchaeum ethanivorans TaxID=2608793 RepID=A0A811TA15_9EURY|nr:MAG: hypothetical protein EMLJLAPB_00339 [Candidatus Argoarchaeum ethanivorans]